MPKNRPKLLIIDDEKDVCAFQKVFFQRRNFSVSTAQTAARALALVKKERPDIAIIDIHMDKTDGIQILKKLLKAEPGCVCIMVTWDREKALEAKKLGARDFLLKPVELPQLEKRVLELINKPDRKRRG